MNNSGNVGKSMVCDTLLKPRIKQAQTIKIETLNSDGSLDDKISSKNIKQVFERMDAIDVALIDIGSSNIENFMNNLSKLEGAHEDIDFFFIPTTTTPKQQVDTISTIEGLLDLGVNKQQIKIIFNFYDPDLKVSQLYPLIFESSLSKTLGLDKMSNVFTITDNPVFDMVGEMGKSFAAIANDDRDFKELIRSTEDPVSRALLSHQRTAHRLATGFNRELDLTFSKIIAACGIVLEG